MTVPPGTLCNECKKPANLCLCARNAPNPTVQSQTGTYPYWSRVPLFQYHTPRRPTQHSAFGNPATQELHSHHAQTPMPSAYPVYPPVVIDPRAGSSQAAPISAVPLHPIYTYHNPTLLHTPSTPLPNSGQIPSATRTWTANLPTIQESPAPRTVNSKRKRNDGAKISSKRAKQTDTQLDTAEQQRHRDTLSVPGVGPSLSCQARAPAMRPKPISDYSPISKPHSKPMDSKQLATDVWYFMRPLDSRERPTGPISEHEPSRSKPKAPIVGCRLCPIDTSWKTWTNTNGIADTIRTHLQSKHGEHWRKIVLLEKLKGWEKLAQGEPAQSPREPFTLEGFLERLCRWIAIDDQSLNVVETPELRELLLYLNADLIDSNIPHQTKLTQLIFKSYHREWKKLVAELQNSLGRVSFTSDLWSDPNLRAFMAITAHFASKDNRSNLIVCNRLIAFRHISGTHCGANLAEHFIQILKELGIQHKIGMITLDNASNCGTMMEDLERLLRGMGIPFHSEGNRIRCFPHVVNIAVKAALKELSSSAPEVTEADDVPSVHESNDSTFEYQAALESDVVSKCRSLVAACRSSGQRRDDLQNTITDGNLSKSFPNAKQLRNVQLLRDMDVRWSSTYLMIDRVLELYPAIDALLNKMKYRDCHHHLLLDTELQVLRDIADFLKIPHAVQTTLCGEQTPTLSSVLPTYEDLLEMLQTYRMICPQLRRAISVCIAKIEDYVNKSRKTRIYALSMIINPITKLKWIEDHWTSEEHQAAKDWILNSMLEYQIATCTGSRSERAKQSSQDKQSSSYPTQSIGPSTLSAQSQANGLAYIRSLKAKLKQTASQILRPPLPTSPAKSDAEMDAERSLDEKNRVMVEDELKRYIEEGLINEEEYKDFSLTRYWQSRQYQFPSLYRVALDILPVQASSVPCERVFSSSKETITMRRSNLSPELLEILQFLKYAYRQDRLSLTEGLVSLEKDLLIAQTETELISAAQVRELLTKGAIDELICLLDSNNS